MLCGFCTFCCCIHWEAKKLTSRWSDSWRLPRRHVKAPGIGSFYMRIESSDHFEILTMVASERLPGFRRACMSPRVRHTAVTAPQFENTTRNHNPLRWKYRLALVLQVQFQKHNSRTFYMPPIKRKIHSSSHYVISQRRLFTGSSGCGQNNTNYNDVRFLICNFISWNESNDA